MALLLRYLIMPVLPDFTQPQWFAIAVVVFFLVIIGRYFLIAGLFDLVFYKWYKSSWSHRKLGTKDYAPGQFRREVFWSICTAMIFSFAGAVTLIIYQRGLTAVYENIHAYPLWYLPVSLILSMLAHEVYYYWIHRWMHKPAIFRIVHKVHHDSRITSPWTAFSFHPIEGLLQAIALPVILILIPIHPYVLVVQLVIMSISSVINHLDIEIFPRKFYKNPIGKYIIGATHHALHHRQYRYNYGLYFTIFDRLHRTESPLYDKQIAEEIKPIR